MPKNDELIAQKNEEIYTDPQLNQVRREQRAIEDDGWIKALLRGGAYGTLATAAGEQPFLNPHNYVYDEAQNCLYFHRSRSGAPVPIWSITRGLLSGGGDGTDVRQHDPLNFSVEYRSVIIFGTAHRVGEEEASRALRLLLVKYVPTCSSVWTTPPAWRNAQRRRVPGGYRVLEWQEERGPAADHPGAYAFK